VELAANLYRIAQEATTNAAKHAEATRVSLHLTMRQAPLPESGGAEQEIELVVDDDGQPNSGRPVRSGLGLLGMRERVAALGGRLSFEAGRGGSVLRVVIPAAAAAGSLEGRNVHAARAA
jgi:signal transduction histidine kinase